jgi:tRNA(fMet)-specific endonuclease VapC
MRYMLGLDACLDLIRKRPAAILGRLRGWTPGDVGLSALTLAELRRAAARSGAPESDGAALERFLLPLEIADFGTAAADAYGRVRAGLDAARTPLSRLEALVAAHALSLGAVLISRGAAGFRRVPGLRVEDWMGSAASSAPPAASVSFSRPAPRPAEPEDDRGDGSPLDPSLL